MREQAIAVKRRDHRLALQKAIDEIVAALARRPEVQRAVLFGSHAEGRRDLFTDLDIFIVMESSLDFVTQTAEMYRYLSPAMDTDLLVYTPEEWERCKRRGFSNDPWRKVRSSMRNRRLRQAPLITSTGQGLTP